MTDYQPTVPNRVRDVVYFIGLGVAALILLAVGVVSIWFPGIAPQVSQTGVVVGQAVALVTAGLGVIYRPGAQHYRQ